MKGRKMHNMAEFLWKGKMGANVSFREMGARGQRLTENRASSLAQLKSIEQCWRRVGAATEMQVDPLSDKMFFVCVFSIESNAELACLFLRSSLCFISWTLAPPVTETNPSLQPGAPRITGFASIRALLLPFKLKNREMRARRRVGPFLLGPTHQPVPLILVQAPAAKATEAASFVGSSQRWLVFLLTNPSTVLPINCALGWKVLNWPPLSLSGLGPSVHKQLKADNSVALCKNQTVYEQHKMSQWTEKTACGVFHLLIEGSHHAYYHGDTLADFLFLNVGKRDPGSKQQS